MALYLHPQYVFMAWCLVKHRDNFNLYLYLFFSLREFFMQLLWKPMHAQILLTYSKVTSTTIIIKQILFMKVLNMIQDSSIIKVFGYGTDEQGSILGMGRDFSLHHHVQTDSWAHPTFYPMDT
jgi:hypothetical protein